MRRRFNGSERTALYLAADGRCESCGTELEPGWHADHVHPYSEGGPTDVINGAALCPSCNLTKGRKIMADDPRATWQKAAVEKFVRTAPGIDFLVTACPGAGKTRMALMAAKRLKDDGQIDRIIIVVPSLALQFQWAQVAHDHFGLDIVATFKNGDGTIRSDADGVAAHYSTVAKRPDIWRDMALRRRTLVIFDEIHHCQDGEEDHTTWGPAIIRAFGDASRRLLLSGTPFRTDRTRIPFVEYDSDGMSISHHGMSYGQAVSLGIVRPLRFAMVDGTGEWLYGTRRNEARAADVSDDDLPNLLKSLYAPDGQWIDSVLRMGDAELTRIRSEGLSNAGGIIIASSKFHAERYAALMSAICGEQVPCVYDDPSIADPTEIIDRFRRGNARWIVAVDMISEGVDIPRAATLIYASRKKTLMWFRQISGRPVRRNDDDATATIFIPAIPILAQYAMEIEEEASAGIEDGIERLTQRMESEQRELNIDIAQPLSSSEARIVGVITSGEEVTEEEIARAEEMIRRFGRSLTACHAADLALVMREGAAPKVTATVVVPPTTSTTDQIVTKLRQQHQMEVGRAADRTGRTPKEINTEAIRVHGNRVPTATQDELRKRIEWLRGLM